MNAGQVVESGTANDVINSPKDDYTKKLLSAVPRITT
jgi:peptide/nickel transport system ATP-binding protein